jgi:hypothetical protein
MNTLRFGLNLRITTVASITQKDYLHTRVVLISSSTDLVLLLLLFYNLSTSQIFAVTMFVIPYLKQC